MLTMLNGGWLGSQYDCLTGLLLWLFILQAKIGASWLAVSLLCPGIKKYPMKTLCHVSVVFLIAVVFAGCSTVDSRIKKNPELFATLSPENQELIRKKQIAIGFTPDMVRLAVGEPDIMTARNTVRASYETWRYTGFGSASFSAGYDSSRFSSYRGYAGSYYSGYYGSYSPSFYGNSGGYSYYSPTMSYRSTPQVDYLRVTFVNGKVSEIYRVK